jgi:hypothetical protein
MRTTSIHRSFGRKTNRLELPIRAVLAPVTAHAKRSSIASCLLGVVFCATGVGQIEVLTNAKIIDMTKAGLSAEIILAKIKSSVDRFDSSSDALIAMKNAGVADDVINAVLQISRSSGDRSDTTTFSTAGEVADGAAPGGSPLTALRTARTIAIQKSSLNPSRQALEKELLKRADWRLLNLTIEQYKENADLYIDIGFVPLSLVTHRYVYRIYDRRTGAVIAAGETTSWGSLAKHLAKHICDSLSKIKSGAAGSLGQRFSCSSDDLATTGNTRTRGSEENCAAVSESHMIIEALSADRFQPSEDVDSVMTASALTLAATR